MSKEADKKPPAWKSLIAGGAAGSIEAAITYPFEFAKTRLQLVDKTKHASKNPLTLIYSTAKNDGIRVIYTGCTSLVAGCGLKAATRFLGFDTFKKMLADDNGKLTPMRGVLAGLGAGVLESVIAVTPAETIKTALIDDAQSKNPRYKGLIHGSTLLFKEKGFHGVYRGLVPVTLRQAANSAVRLGSYTHIKQYLQNISENPQAPLSSAKTFLVGVFAGIITVYTTMPLDTVKTRMQSLDASSLYTSTWDCATKIARQEGILTFWKGTTPRLGRLMLSGGIIFTIYEKVMILLS